MAKDNYRHKQRTLDKGETYIVLDRYRQGQTISEIANFFSVPKAPVSNIVNKHGYEDWIKEWEEENIPVESIEQPERSSNKRTSNKRKLEKEKVFEILDRYSNGEPPSKMVEDYSASCSVIYAILNKRTYKNWVEEWEEENNVTLGEIETPSHLKQLNLSQRELDKKEIYDVLERYYSGETIRGIAEDYPVSDSSVSMIIHGEIYEDWVKEWKEGQENLERGKVKQGKPNNDGRRSRRKLDKEQVFEILDRLHEGESPARVAKDFPVNSGALYQIIQGGSYRDWVEEWEENHGPLKVSSGKKLSRSDVFAILRRLQNGETYSSIAEDFPCSRSTIGNIKNKRSKAYKDWVEEWQNKQ